MTTQQRLSTLATWQESTADVWKHMAMIKCNDGFLIRDYLLTSGVNELEDV